MLKVSFSLLLLTTASAFAQAPTAQEIASWDLTREMRICKKASKQLIHQLTIQDVNGVEYYVEGYFRNIFDTWDRKDPVQLLEAKYLDANTPITAGLSHQKIVELTDLKIKKINARELSRRPCKIDFIAANCKTYRRGCSIDLLRDDGLRIELQR